MSWKDDLYQYELTETADLDLLTEQATEAANDDVGMINSKSGSGLLARENGVLEGFADYGLGFRFSPDTQSLSVYAPNIHLFATDIQKHDRIEERSYLREEYGEVERLLTSDRTEETHA